MHHTAWGYTASPQLGIYHPTDTCKCQTSWQHPPTPWAAATEQRWCGRLSLSPAPGHGTSERRTFTNLSSPDFSAKGEKGKKTQRLLFQQLLSTKLFQTNWRGLMQCEAVAKDLWWWPDWAIFTQWGHNVYLLWTLTCIWTSPLTMSTFCPAP